MSLTIENTPAPISFLGNRPEFRIAVSNSSGGTMARFGILLTSAFPLGKSIVITVGGRELKFTKSVTDTSYTFSSADGLKDALANNYYLSDILTVEDAPDGDTTATFYLCASTYGPLGVTVTATSSTGCTITGADGTSPTSSDNYSVVARLESNLGHTSWVHLYPADGEVKLTAEMLRGFFPSPTLPAVTPTLTLQTLPDLLSYRLRYAESYGSSPLVQKLYATDYLKLISGELTEPYASQNLPDWFDENPTLTLHHASTYVLRVLGENSGSQSRIHESETQYLYLFALNTGATATDTYTITLRVRPYSSTGYGTATETTFTLTNGTLYRLPIAPFLFSLGDASAFNIEVYNPNDTVSFSRTYTILPDADTQHSFLLQNRYGMLQSFVCSQVTKAATFEGDELLNEGHRLVDVTSRYETFTATSDQLPESEAALLAHSFSGEYCYMMVNDRWQRIVIKPASVTYHQDTANLVTLSFEFYFHKNQVDNIAMPNSSTDTPALADDVILTEDGYLLTTEADEPLQFE